MEMPHAIPLNVSEYSQSAQSTLGYWLTEHLLGRIEIALSRVKNAHVIHFF